MGGHDVDLVHNVAAAQGIDTRDVDRKQTVRSAIRGA
jgi:hypothetical protein